MNRFKYLFPIVIFLFSCSKSDNSIVYTCGTSDPIYSISWLNKIRKDFEETPQSSFKRQIVYYRYKEQDVFKISGLQQSVDSPIYLYDCDQNIICTFGGILNNAPCPDFYSEATNERVLYEK